MRSCSRLLFPRGTPVTCKEKSLPCRRIAAKTPHRQIPDPTPAPVQNPALPRDRQHYYPAQTRIRLILDNHSAHLSRETRSFLATCPNRFEFIFTPTHGSWLNLIESFFAKMAKIFLRGLQVSSKKELKQQLEQYLKEINETPVVFRWKYGLESLTEV